MKNRDKKCKECTLPVYARDMCRRHYKSWNAKKNNYYKRRWKKVKNNPILIEKKRESDKMYRDKKKNDVDTERKKDDNALINQDWQKYAKQWSVRVGYFKRQAKISQKNYHENRLKAFEKYGGCRCSSCGVEDERVLTFDHINNDGAQHRKEINQLNMVSWIVKNNYPPIFQILCRNCNWIKELERQSADFNKRNS